MSDTNAVEMAEIEIENENIEEMAAEVIQKNFSSLLSPQHFRTEQSLDVKEASLENIMAALEVKNDVPMLDFTHKISGLKFKLQPMSSEGYTKLYNVERYNPQGTAKLSMNSDDEQERHIVYLTYGITSPRINREVAEKMLVKKGWGPSNVDLIDAIKDLNPDPSERITSFMLMSGYCRYVNILLMILDQAGTLDELMDSKNIKPEIKSMLLQFNASFFNTLRSEEVCQQWGIPLNRESLINEEAKDDEE